MERQFVEIAFRQAGELFLFDTGGLELKGDDRVIVETEHGQALGTVKSVCDSTVKPPANFQLFRVLRMASAEDLNRERRHQSKEKEAFEFCSQKIIEFGLPMKLIRAEYFFSGSKLLFYFSAEGRVDFRALVRDLARFFQKRIEMRQIGVRDSAKLIGGIGPCGQQLCCNRFLRQFNPVSIRMAKDQSLPLNPQKVSGVCGRLMCCLSYEQNVYQEMRRRLPRVGEDVETTQGVGKVREVFPLQEKVRVVFMDRESPSEEEIKIEDLPQFRKQKLPDFIPVISAQNAEKNAKGKRRPRRGLEPLMEPRHPNRNGGRRPRREEEKTEPTRKEQEAYSSHNERNEDRTHRRKKTHKHRHSAHSESTPQERAPSSVESNKKKTTGPSDTGSSNKITSAQKNELSSTEAESSKQEQTHSSESSQSSSRQAKHNSKRPKTNSRRKGKNRRKGSGGADSTKEKEGDRRKKNKRHRKKKQDKTKTKEE